MLVVVGPQCSSLKGAVILTEGKKLGVTQCGSLRIREMLHIRSA
jgi:hypothetical protein